MILYILIFIITVTVLLLFCNSVSKKRQVFQGMPKGPTGLPIIGNILQLRIVLHKKLSEWAMEFGRFYTLDIFGVPALVINDPKTMRDIFGNPNATGKYTVATVDMIHGPDYGIVNSEGSVWAEQHKFFMKVLREFGFHGGNQLTSVILKECNDLCNWIDNEIQSGSSLNIRKTLLYSVTTIINNAVTGERHTRQENKIGTLLDNLIKSFNEATILTFMPWLRFVAPEKSGWNKLVQTSGQFQEFVQASFGKRKCARHSNTENVVPVNIIDAYLDQVENCQDVNSTFYGEQGMKHGLFAVVNMLIAGSETTSSSVIWIIHYLLAYPDVQRKLQDEVDAVVKTEKDLVSIDKAKLPYLEAVFLEVLRISTMAPLGVIHKLLDTVNYDGYTLPKGTYLLANIYHANNDPKVWKDPQTFRPERFLEGTEADRKRLKDCMVAFQEGRRRCPGEQAAKNMVFWYTFKLVEQFSFHKEEKRSAKEYLEPVAGFLLLPPELGIVVKPRKK